MKKYYFILALTIILIGGCSALVSVGDSNNNTINHTENLNYKG